MKQNAKIYCRATWRYDVRVQINVNYLRINISGLKKKIFCFVGLADNLLAKSGENIFDTRLNNRYGR